MRELINDYDVCDWVWEDVNNPKLYRKQLFIRIYCCIFGENQRYGTIYNNWTYDNLLAT